MDIKIFDRQGNEAETIKVGENAELIQQFQGQDVIQLNHLSNRKLDLDVGYYITFENTNYYINKPPQITKQGTNRFEYQITFDSHKYDLGRVQLKTIDNTQFVDGLTEFYLHGNAQMFVQLIVDNMNQEFSGWSVGTIDSTDRKLIKFKGDNCLKALKKVADKFSLEFQVDGKTIHVQDNIENNIAKTLSYGPGKGIRSLSRSTKNNNKLVTRVYAYGSPKNLPHDYRNHARRLRFGKLYNLLGNVGLMDDLSYWEQVDVSDGSLELNTDSYLFGDASINHKFANKWKHPITLQSGQYYLVAGYIYQPTNEDGNAENKIIVGANDSLATLSHSTQDGEWHRLATIFQSDRTDTGIYIEKTYSSGVKSRYDGLQITEITENEYNNYTIDELLDRYPFTSKNQVLNFVERNINQYGVREITKFYDDVYPEHTGTITNVDDNLNFYDDNWPFDISQQLIGGVTAKLHFQTGDLAGYEFEFSYDHSKKKFTLSTISGQQGLTLPNDTLNPSVDDTFKVIDIKMPQKYIDNAESRLKNKAQTYLVKHSELFQVVGYDLNLDWKYCRNNSLKLRPGDSFTVNDPDFNISEIFRVIKVRRPLVFPYKQQVKVAKHPETDDFVEMKAKQDELEENQQISRVGDINIAIKEKIHSI